MIMMMIMTASPIQTPTTIHFQSSSTASVSADDRVVVAGDERVAFVWFVGLAISSLKGCTSDMFLLKTLSKTDLALFMASIKALDGKTAAPSRNDGITT